jgi:hypothetical protein
MPLVPGSRWPRDCPMHAGLHIGKIAMASISLGDAAPKSPLRGFLLEAVVAPRARP